MFKLRVSGSWLMGFPSFLFLVTMGLACSSVAGQSVSMLKREATCYAIESISNEFTLVRLNLENNEVVSTIYGSGVGDTLVAHELVEYSETKIGNMDKIGTCYPVKTDTDKGFPHIFHFANACSVNDPAGLIFSVGIKYKLDVLNRTGHLNVKSYFYDGTVFEERQYTFYNCF